MNESSWLRRVHDSNVSAKAKQLAGIIFTRLASNDRVFMFDADPMAFLDATSSQIGEWRRELIAHGFLHPYPNNGGSKPKYRLTHGTIKRAVL